MKQTQQYHIGDTLTLDNGRTVVIRKVINSIMLRVSYGFDTTGKDIVGVILISMIK